MSCPVHHADMCHKHRVIDSSDLREGREGTSFRGDLQAARLAVDFLNASFTTSHPTPVIPHDPALIKQCMSVQNSGGPLWNP